ncbi:glutamate receptor ionotropic, NMDA 2D-like [Herpailurus yagouaroundi]|uniref:glutamate receptor ionotropic, NMDA 2D-like n=1 Tax=Herpailurus yagouaroundi TaxID=1608482 RepID=UPI001AD76786|nr:glutamate receptor ionotropic, NMDA 2D-like [Puma yagouaroundi]
MRGRSGHPLGRPSSPLPGVRAPRTRPAPGSRPCPWALRAFAAGAEKGRRREGFGAAGAARGRRFALTPCRRASARLPPPRADPSRPPPSPALAAGDSSVVTQFPLGSAWGLHRRSRKCAVPGALPCSETRPRGCFLEPHPLPPPASSGVLGEVWTPSLYSLAWRTSDPRDWRGGGGWGEGRAAPPPPVFQAHTVLPAPPYLPCDVNGNFSSGVASVHPLLLAHPHPPHTLEQARASSHQSSRHHAHCERGTHPPTRGRAVMAPGSEERTMQDIRLPL